MLTGKTFRLRTAVLAVENLNGERSMVSLPRGALLHVISEPEDGAARMVDIRWLGRHLVIFAIDLQDRGHEVKETDL